MKTISTHSHRNTFTRGPILMTLKQCYDILKYTLKQILPEEHP